jgi:alanine dehydrogenase
VLDVNIAALQRIRDRHPCLTTVFANPVTIARASSFADVLVGAVLVPGGRSPIVVTREMVKAMKPRSLVMDISIDEGGCVETSRPTTHDHPTFIQEGVIHYCVPNIPGVVARTATHAYVNAAFPYLEQIATEGVDAAMLHNTAIARGIETHMGKLVNLSRVSSIESED